MVFIATFWLVCGVYRHGFGWFVVFIATVLVGLWCLSPRFWLVCGVYRHGFGFWVYRHGLVSLWCLSPRFWLVCGVYRHGFG